jgi:pimeloyl-ACP methyl ester carboxylesterase
VPVTKVGDINIYYEVHGKGEPLLLIMGYGSNSGHWFAILDKLAKEHRVIVFDNRGTGRSDKPSVPYTAEMMVGDVSGLLDVIGVDTTDIFGVSMGGLIAQGFALSYPKRINSLVLGCTTCGGVNAIPATKEAAGFLFNPEAAKLTGEEKALATIPWLWNGEFIEKNPGTVKRYVAVTTEHPTPPESYMSQANFLLTYSSYDRLPELKAPTLVVCGDKDRLIPPENSRILASRIPNAELAVIENAGHGFITDNAEESSKIILNFLRKHSKKGKS